VASLSGREKGSVHRQRKGGGDSPGDARPVALKGSNAGRWKARSAALGKRIAAEVKCLHILGDTMKKRKIDIRIRKGHRLGGGVRKL